MKTIVIYFGYGKHTRMIAQRVKEELGCDILEIKPKIPYSSDYQTVVNETEDNLYTKETTEIENIEISLDNYEKVILGTPVWWYTITPPIRTFLTKYDLSGKTIYPFATNAGWLGSTFDEIRELCKGTIKEEMNIKFSTDYAENKLVTSDFEIENWINKVKEDNEWKNKLPVEIN
ncbi:MAG: flavodoxin [Erysipelotrichaceae bacterium]|nr:flavodoxin [Erysipelotrichaceae bacterium]